MKATNLTINGQRLWDSLMELAKIGATEKGGVCRLTLTELDKKARDLFASWCKAAGATITVDRLGNVFARRVVYFPQTGRMRVRKLTAGRDETLVAQERQYLRQLDTSPPDGEIELF